jgi:hypothetical protein
LIPVRSNERYRMPAWISQVSTWRSSLRPTPTSRRPTAQLGSARFPPRESARLRPKLSIWQANQWARYHTARKLAKPLRPSSARLGPIRRPKFSRSGSHENVERARPRDLAPTGFKHRPKNFTCVAHLKTSAPALNRGWKNLSKHSKAPRASGPP